MAAKQIAWNTGTGNITLTYQGQGDGPISIHSDANNGGARSQVITIETVGGAITRDFTINQAACPFPVCDVRNFSYTGSYQEVELPAGQYKLQCWGAQGGSNAAASSYGITAKAGGKGGYSEGIITLSTKTTVRIYVGGQGSSSAGGFNGGGSTTGSASYSSGNKQGVSRMGGGGGATDIRLSDGALLSRMIVAGGGSGGAMCFKSILSSNSYNSANCVNIGGILYDGSPESYAYTKYSRNNCTNDGILKYDGTLVTDVNWGVSDKIYLTDVEEVSYEGIWTAGATSWGPLCIYNSSNVVIWRGTGQGSVSISTLSGASYLRFFKTPSGGGAYPYVTLKKVLTGFYYSNTISLSGATGLSYTGLWTQGGTSWSPLCVYNSSGTVIARGSGSGTIDLTSLPSASYIRFFKTPSGNGASPSITITSSSTSTASQEGYVGGGVNGGGYDSSYQGKQNAAGTGGSFGQGANQTTTNYRYCSGAGGGGWYGGGGGQKSDSSMTYCEYSGGGSGFVNTAASAGNRPSGYTGLELDSGTTYAGNQSFPSTGSGNETGHAGNGYARITRIE